MKCAKTPRLSVVSELRVSRFRGLTLGTNLWESLSGVDFSCWLSLEGGLLYAFVGPAAAVVLVNIKIHLFCLFSEESLLYFR